MKRLDLARYTVNRDYSVWPIDFAMSASFEMPAARLQAALPPGVHVFEPRPGLGLLNLAVFHFTADTDGLTAPCTEFVASAHVMPNLALAPTLPRLSMCTLRLGATTREFIDSRFCTDVYPVYPDPLVIDIDRERIAVQVRDAAGAPIAALAAAEGVTPPYGDDRFYVQSSAAVDGQLWLAGNLFEFRRAENQRNLVSAGSPSPHPFFGGLDVSGVTARDNQLQMWSAPGSIGHEYHFFLQPVG
jgi:hypothetical protein